MNQLVNRGRQDAVHVRRQVQYPHGNPRSLGLWYRRGGAALAEPGSLVCERAGIKVVAPSTPADAKGLLITAIRDNNPVLFMEHKLLYRLKGPVPEETYTIPLQSAEVKREGRDLTLSLTRSWCPAPLKPPPSWRPKALRSKWWTRVA